MWPTSIFDLPTMKDSLNKFLVLDYLDEAKIKINIQVKELK